MAVPPELAEVRKRLYGQYRRSLAKGLSGAPDYPLGSQMRQYRQRWHRFLPPDREARILDIGCGGGEFLLFLSQEGFCNLEGIDLSPEQVELAHQRGLQAVKLVDAITYLGGHSRSFDMINIQNVLEHQTRPELLELMDAIVAALRPGGMVFGVVPNSKSIFSTRIRYADLTHELSFTPESLRQLFTVVGLTSVALLEHGPLVHNLISSARWLAWQLIRLGIWIAYVAENADYLDRVYTHDMMFVARKDGASCGL